MIDEVLLLALPNKRFRGRTYFLSLLHTPINGGGTELSTKLLRPCEDILKLLLSPELHGVSPTG